MSNQIQKIKDILPKILEDMTNAHASLINLRPTYCGLLGFIIRNAMIESKRFSSKDSFYTFDGFRMELRDEKENQSYELIIKPIKKEG